MTAAATTPLQAGEQQTVRNNARFIADYYLQLAAIRAEEKTRTPTDAQIDRTYRQFRRLWSRTAYAKVNDLSSAARTWADWHWPLLQLLGFSEPPTSREIDIDPEQVRLRAYEDGAHPVLLVDPLPFAKTPDERLETGQFRGTAQRRMERALEGSAAPFGLILGGTRWRIVKLDTANEPRFLEFDLAAIHERDDLDAFGLLVTLLSPSALLGEAPLLADLIERSEARGTQVGEELGPATRRALQQLLESVRTDEANIAWTPDVFVEDEPLQAIHREGVYFLYRLLFVLYAEANGALPLDKPLYRDSYSLERIRADLSNNAHFAENSYALWDSVQALFRLIDTGARAKEMTIPAYNGGLFARERTVHLDRAAVNDAAFAQVLRELTTVTLKVGKRKQTDRVSFRELGVDQLGAVFESLLDYEPQIAHEVLFEVPVGAGKSKGISFLPASALGNVSQNGARLAEGQFYLQAWGGQRKSTGAFYTPRPIADYLVREALRPQVEGKSGGEILEIAVCDPAMGSGGFLVSATEFLGEAYYNALVREGIYDHEDESADDDRIAAKRLVAERCIYGVDLNPMAVELAKVSLWLTTLSFDRPLSFFDHHLRCGNSLLGSALRYDGRAITGERIQTLPDAAFADVDKEAMPEEKTRLKPVRKRNAAQLNSIAEAGRVSVFMLDLHEPLESYAKAREQLSVDDPTQSAEDAVALVRAKERRLRDLTEDPRSQFFMIKEICDLWMSPWFWPYDATIDPPTTDEYQEIARDVLDHGGPRRERGQLVLDESRRIAKRHRFFHWEVEFPEVFERGGFHAIVGNPPWEVLEPKTQEFFSNYDPQFRQYGRQKAVAKMRQLRSDQHIEAAYRRYARFIYGVGAFLKDSGTYSWYAPGNLGKGGLDLFRSFIERDFRALREAGRVAQLLKDSIYINANCSEIRRQLIQQGSIRAFVVNENRKGVFPIDSRIKIALIVAERGMANDVIPSAFFVGKASDLSERSLSTSELQRVLAVPAPYLIPVPIELIKMLSPESLAFIEVTDNQDVKLFEHLTRKGAPLGSVWAPRYCQELNVTLASNLFVERSGLERIGATFDGVRWQHPTEGEFWPLVEGKHIYQYEFPVAEFTYWVNAKHSSRLPALNGKPVNFYPRLAWRNVASSTNERSVIAEIIPAKSFLAHSLQSIAGGAFDEQILPHIQALFDSFVFDWQIRMRGATNLTHSLTDAALVPPVLIALDVLRQDRVNTETAVMATYGLPFDLAEHLMSGFPLLDRLQPPLASEVRSTMTRDLVLARYAEMLDHPKAGFYRDRADRATALGAKPFIPATRAESQGAEGDAPEVGE